MTDRPVLVGFDGSEDADRAVRWAATYARAVGAPLEVVHTYDYPYLDRLGDDLGRQLHDAAAAAAEAGVAAARAAEPTVSVEASVAVGEPANVLVERSASAQLLVVGRQGSHRGLHHMLGSVAARCVHHAACPVTVVR